MYKIPKILHYCWFGNNTLPKSSVRFIHGWKKKCPDFKIIKWSEKNFDINKYLFVKRAYKDHNWAAVSDYVRLVILYKFGGIYLDTDVEILQSLDPLLINKSFIGMEDYGVINNGLIYGVCPRDSNVKRLLDIYNRIAHMKKFNECCLDEVHIVTTYFHSIGFKYNDKLQVINGCKIYPTSYFCPEKYESNTINLVKNTYTIHHYFGSWTGSSLHGKKKFNFVVRKYLRKVLGTKLFLMLYRKHMFNKKGIY